MTVEVVDGIEQPRDPLWYKRAVFYEVHDELSGATWTWAENNYVRLDPFVAPAHVFVVRRGTQ